MWLIVCIILISGLVFLYIKHRDLELLETVTESDRGTKSERNLVLKLLKHGIPAQTIFHDLYLKKHSGNYSQIDLVVTTNVGIIVFEVKDYSGWIYGSGNQPQWTKVLAYGKNKYRFYNPIMQNTKHIIDLRNQLRQFVNIPFYSIVVFYGDCEFKDISFIPNGTFLVKSSGVMYVIKRILKNNKQAYNPYKSEIVKVLKEAARNGGNQKIQNQHIENIKDMLGKDRIFD